MVLVGVGRKAKKNNEKEQEVITLKDWIDMFYNVVVIVEVSHQLWAFVGIVGNLRNDLVTHSKVTQVILTCHKVFQLSRREKSKNVSKTVSNEVMQEKTY